MYFTFVNFASAYSITKIQNYMFYNNRFLPHYSLLVLHSLLVGDSVGHSWFDHCLSPVNQAHAQKNVIHALLNGLSCHSRAKLHPGTCKMCITLPVTAVSCSPIYCTFCEFSQAKISFHGKELLYIANIFDG